MQCLPLELLSEVFINCLPESHQCDTPSLSQCEAPLLFGQVSRRWRNVSLSTPRLWATFVLNGMTVQEIKRETKALQYDFWSHGDNELGCALDCLITVIILHCQRWQHITGQLPWFCLQRLIATFSHGVILLETLNISIEGPYDEPSVIDLSATHRLTSLLLDGANCKIIIGDSPYQYLRRVDLSKDAHLQMSMDDCLAFLHRCPSIVSFKIRLGDNKPIRSGIKTLTVLHLAQLSLSAVHDYDIGPLLDRLHLPVLEELTLRMDGSRKAYWPHLMSLLKQSKSSFLEALYLTGTPIMQDDFIACLQQAPLLKTLSVNRVALTDPVIRALTQSSIQPKQVMNLCPNLSQITFTSCLPYLSQSALADMILSRWDPSCRRIDNELEEGHRPPGRKLRKFLITRCGSQLDGLLQDPAIQKCVEEGLELTIQRFF